jgi:hypothetical protein
MIRRAGLSGISGFTGHIGVAAALTLRGAEAWITDNGMFGKRMDDRSMATRGSRSLQGQQKERP